jgi:hypothetical protein
MSEVRRKRRQRTQSGKLITNTGHLRQLNELARNAKADYIIHTGDFGFYDETSIERIAEK